MSFSRALRRCRNSAVFIYYVYILKSLKDNRYYTGSTGNIYDRIKHHKKGISKATKNSLPLELTYKKIFSTKSEKIKFEKETKKQKIH